MGVLVTARLAHPEAWKTSGLKLRCVQGEVMLECICDTACLVNAAPLFQGSIAAFSQQQHEARSMLRSCALQPNGGQLSQLGCASNGRIFWVKISMA